MASCLITVVNRDLNSDVDPSDMMVREAKGSMHEHDVFDLL